MCSSDLTFIENKLDHEPKKASITLFGTPTTSLTSQQRNDYHVCIVYCSSIQPTTQQLKTKFSAHITITTTPSSKMRTNQTSYTSFTETPIQEEYHTAKPGSALSPNDYPTNTHITIGVLVGVVVLVAILVVIWCFRPCTKKDRRMKNASTATSIASI